MTELVVNTARHRTNFLEARAKVPRLVIAALLTSIAYYVGAKVGLALTFQPHPVSTLWPPNAILLAALLLSPPRWWFFILLAVFPTHLLVELGANIPASMTLSWFLSNCTEALIGALVFRYLAREEIRFDSTRSVGMFLVAAALGPFLSSFLDAGFVVLNRYGQSPYWDVFRMRVFSNVLASVTLVPLIVTWRAQSMHSLRGVRWSRYVELFLLVVGLVLVGLISFGTQRAGQNTTPAFLYLPLPLMLWAAIRFGPRGSSTALLAVSFFAIWGAIHGLGPFATQSAEMNALSVQLFLILASMPLLFLAALIKERERSKETALQEEERLSMALDAAQMGTWDWRIAEDTADWSAQSKRMLGLATDISITSEAFYSLIHVDDRTRIKEAIKHSIFEGAPYDAEFRIPQKDGKVRWVRGVGKVILNHNGQPTRMMGVNLDVTNWKLAEEALQETSERNRAILRALPDMVFLISRDGIYLDYHARGPGKLLVPPAAFLGKRVSDVLPRRVAAQVMACLEKAGVTDRPQILDYSLMIDNEERHYEARLIGMEGDKTLSVVRDVTDRQRALQALKDSQEKLHHSHNQIRDLLGRLIDAQEAERRRMSRELHDDLSQRVATLSVSISRLKKKLPMSEAELALELDVLRGHIDNLTNEIRSLSHQLHPAVLEHLGLVTALESFIQSFRNEEQIEVILNADTGEVRIPFQTSICIYRVAVEALRNVARHSAASSAQVSLKCFDNVIELRVSDAGKGFHVETARHGDGLGLVSIEERLRLLQGSCEIKSMPQHGTTIIARAPLS